MSGLKLYLPSCQTSAAGVYWKSLWAPGSSDGRGAKIVGVRTKMEGGRERKPEGSNGSLSESLMKLATVGDEHLELTSGTWQSPTPTN